MVLVCDEAQCGAAGRHGFGGGLWPGGAVLLPGEDRRYADVADLVRPVGVLMDSCTWSPRLSASQAPLSSARWNSSRGLRVQGAGRNVM